ncbi:MAG: IPT/TIG domain-containing protein [Acidobacteriota bacterium]
MADGDRTGLQRFGETAIAFDDLIVQVGRAIARAQQEMDQSQARFQREVLRALQEGRMQRLEVPPPHGYTLPETTLDLRIGLSMQYPEGGGAPELSAVPLNAATANRNDVSVEASTEVSLRFVSVPGSRKAPEPSPSALSPDQAQELARGVPEVAAALAQLPDATLWLDYADEARLWTLAWLSAREPAVVALVDDRARRVVGTVVRTTLPPADALVPVGPPRLFRVTPAAAPRGEVLTAEGDDFLTLAGQTVLWIDGLPVPPVRHSMGAISFKVPDWATRGDVEVATPLGTTGESGRAAFSPLPTFESFAPARGAYDASRLRGTSFSVLGSNLRPGCRIRFATGALGVHEEVLSPGRMQVEVPPGAGSGPLTLVFGEHEQTLATPFVVLPRIERVSPRQARVGDEVTVTGTALDEVAGLALGQAVVPAGSFTLLTPRELRFRVPPDASDGPIVLRTRFRADDDPQRDRQAFLTKVESGELVYIKATKGSKGQQASEDRVLEVASRDLFYVVPRITGFATRVVVRGQILIVYGDGLDPDPDMMVLLFDAQGGPSEAPVLAVSPDRRSLTARVPADAVTGFVLLLRKRVYSELSPADTSTTSLNKLTVLTPLGDPSDVLLEDRFEGSLAAWQPEAGAWRIERGMLVSEGTARLAFTLPDARGAFAVYADVLGAQRFGFSLTPTGTAARLQVWVDLIGAAPGLTWSTVDARGRQTLLGSLAMSVLAGGNLLVQLTAAVERVVDKDVMMLTLLLDQEVVQQQAWDAAGVTQIALLADAPAQYPQHWDNVVVLKAPVLGLPEPALYRFGTLPAPPAAPALRVDGFQPVSGPVGTQVTLTGIGLDASARFFFGGAEAPVLQADGVKAVVTVPAGALTGPIEVRGRGGAVATTGELVFGLPPKIFSLVPTSVLAGAELLVSGTNLPLELDRIRVEVLGVPARPVSAVRSMLTVLVPNVSGTGAVTLQYAGFTATAPQPLEVRRETVLQDLVAVAPQAVWSTSAGPVSFGSVPDSTAPGVQARARERLEDGLDHGPVLYLHPPAPALRALRGAYPPIDVPATGRLELRLELGMLWTAAPQPEDPADVDGVLFEVAFLLTDTGEELSLLPRSACVFDGSLERYVIDAKALAGRYGQVVVSIFPGRSGLRDDAAVVTARLVQVI